MIIPYKREHRERAAELFLETYQAEPFNYSWMDKSGVLKYFADLEFTPKFEGFVLVHENKIAGVCFGVINDYFKNKKYHINEIFIAPRFQKKGLGSEFIKDIADDLKGIGIDFIDLYTEKNIPAYIFYKKNGFVNSENMRYMMKSIKKP